MEDTITVNKSIVNQLSHDVLTYIFAFVGSESFLPATSFPTVDTYNPSPRPAPPAHYLAFSQVCRNWREIALGTPALWNHPLFDHPKLGVLMLERARNSPLTVTWPPQCVERRQAMDCLARTHTGASIDLSQEPKFVDAFNDHVAQISSLDLRLQEDEMKEIYDLVLSKSKMLRKAHLHCIFHGRFNPAFVMDYGNLFVATSLKELHLLDCYLHLPSSAMLCIVTLEIQMSLSGIPVTMHEILDLLSRTPALESLHLDGAIGTIPSTGPKNNAVNLAQLRSIFIHDHAERIAPFLSYICALASGLQKFQITCGPYVLWPGNQEDDLDDDADEFIKFMPDVGNYLKTTLQHDMSMRTAHGCSRLTLDSFQEKTIVIQVGHGSSDLQTRTWNEYGERSPPTDDAWQIAVRAGESEMLDISSIYGLLVRHVDWSSMRSLEIQNYNFDLANPGESTVIGTTNGAPLDDFWHLLPTQN
jgi:hypothetical protein